ncbi:MerR family transcriptional regulator [Yoonia sp. MH D7]
MKYTAGTAAKAVGKTKSTITKAIAGGKISAVKNDSGAWEIDASELHRVYPPYPSDTVEIERSDTPNETSGNSKEIQGLERLLKATEEQLADVKADRDEWRKQANQLLISNGTTPRKKFLGIF